MLFPIYSKKQNRPSYFDQKNRNSSSLSKEKKAIGVLQIKKYYWIRNVERINSTFGNRYFVSRRGEKNRRCSASARLFNEVLEQKIISEMVKLFF